MKPKLAAYIEQLLPTIDDLKPDRIAILDQLVTYCQSKLQSGQELNLTFICTHNSRRSHFSQIWAQVAAHYYGFDRVKTFSGGTATTAFNERAVAALERTGMDIENPGGENPRYQVHYSDRAKPMEAYSKTFDEAPNPKTNFCAVMTCSSADADCPVVFGADGRVALLYVDPKESDGTDAELATYDERCLQIATELFYVWRKVKAELAN
ncbi:MAG: protein-tyrosine-phosphatase [Cytophagales bacterium]|nr:protein-tyrosine-phosphatase [Cytophagales bacterium]